MIMLGLNFMGDSEALSIPAVDEPSFTAVTVGGGIIDDLYASNKYRDTFDIPNKWDFDTILHAKFEGNLLAGNIDYYVSEIDCMRLKRRKVGELNWQTLFEQPIRESKDFKFEWNDITVRARSEYEYSIVPVFGSVEGSFFVSSIETEFNSLFIADKTGVYSTELEVSVSEARNKPRSVILTINRKYPYVVSNGANNYDSGSVSGYFVEKVCNPKDSVSHIYDTYGVHFYRKRFKDFLNNGNTKLLKTDDGRMWLVDISSASITDSAQGHQDFVITSFDWVEVGDCDNADELAIVGLTGRLQ